MTEEELTLRNQRMVRDMSLKLIEQFTSRGVTQADATVGMMMGAFHNAAMLHQGDAHAAVEWTRTIADLIEKEILSEMEPGRG